MTHISGFERDQLLLLPEAVDDYVGSGNPVRFIDAFVDGLDLAAAGFLRVEAKAMGRPGYAPGDLLKLYIYGYLNRVRSSRRLETECHRNIEVIWLLRTLKPDFKTIADFRRDNRAAFRAVFNAPIPSPLALRAASPRIPVVFARSARVTLAARLTGKTAAETISAMLAVFGRIDPHLRRSITFDNDTAFAQHGLLRTMRDMTTWFCDAYASWQKGGIENANGRLRRWLPRHLDIDRTSDREVQEIVLTTNLTPRKCLGFKTPFQALIAELGKDVQIRFS